MSLADVIEALERWEPRELIRGAWDRKDGCCALGAAFFARVGTYVKDSFKRYPGLSEYGICAVGLGIDPYTCHLIAGVNDAFDGAPSDRYRYMLAWLRAYAAGEKLPRPEDFGGRGAP